MKRINLWASPRNISTAIMYSFAQRKDTTVVDEPFYAAYLKKSKVNHPGKAEIIKSQHDDFNEQLKAVYFKTYPSEYVFFKQMSHHLRDVAHHHFLDAINVILIRNPRDMIISFSKVISKPTLLDLGLKESLFLLNYFKDNDSQVMVINSDDLLDKPSLYLQKWCSEMNLPFDGKMLSWPSGSKKEDGVWAPFWYKNVHRSTHFEKVSRPKTDLNEHQKALLSESLEYFNVLNQHAI